MESLLQDVRYALRALRRAPGFAAVAVLTLSLGIGANTAIFTVVNAVLLRLPFPEPERLVVVQNTYPQAATPTSFPDFQEWRGRSQSFDGLGAIHRSSFTFLGGAEPQRFRGAFISQDYAKIMDVEPLLGRLPAADEHKRGAAPVCLLGEQFWQGQFGGDRAVLGRALTLNNFQCSVIGVLPARTPVLGDDIVNVFLPLEARPTWDIRGVNFLGVVGRLRAGVSLEQARQELDRIQAAINEQFPQNAHGIVLTPLADVLVGDTRAPLMVLLAAVGFVLLIACANVANLLLARGAVRQKEFAVREALGARRTRIVRQLLTETSVVAASAAVGGLVLSHWTVRLFERFWPAGMRVPRDVQIDTRVLLFTIAVAALATVVSALLPALRSAKVDLNNTLKETGRGTRGSARDHRVRSAFVVSEVALALMMVVGGLLMTRSLGRLLNSDPGFDPQRLVVLGISRPAGQTSQQRQAFYDQLLPRLQAVQGVESVGATTYVPFSGGGQSGDFTIEGREFPSGQSPFADEIWVLPGYFRAMGINLIEGRDFTERDREGAPYAVIVNRTMAERLWPGEPALGKRVRVEIPAPQWQQIVGVVDDVSSDGLGTQANMQVYMPYLQNPQGSLAVLVRSRAPAENIVGTLKQEVYALDRAQPVNATLMEQLVSRSVSRPRATALLLSAFALLSMVLAVIGIYGVIAYSVNQRVHEIGIRMALGAGREQIGRMVVGTGLRLAAVGVVIGTVGALLVSRLLRGLLYGVAATDPVTYAAAAALLIAAALLASYIPARRATMVDPVVALRYE